MQYVHYVTLIDYFSGGVDFDSEENVASGVDLTRKRSRYASHGSSQGTLGLPRTRIDIKRPDAPEDLRKNLSEFVNSYRHSSFTEPRDVDVQSKNATRAAFDKSARISASDVGHDIIDGHIKRPITHRQKISMMADYEISSEFALDRLLSRDGGDSSECG